MTVTHDMTVGKPSHCILRFALPLTAGYLLQQLYTVADAAIVGHQLGVDALAAIGASWSVTFLIMGFCNGACAGFSIPVAQAFGGGDYKLMRRYAAAAVRMATLVTVILTLSTTVTCGPILQMVSTPSDIYHDAYIFLLLQLLAIPFTMAYNLLASLIRALGNAQQPFYFLIMASMLNIGLDILFIVVAGMGVEGAGIATMLSQAVAAWLCLRFINRQLRQLIPQQDEWKADRKLTLHLLANGIPMGLQFSITGVGIIMLQRANNALGTACVAAFTASMRVKYLFTCVFENIGATMAVYCGQNIGANKLPRISSGLRDALLLSLSYFVLTCIIIQPFAPHIMLLFVESGETEIIAKAAMLIRINCWFYPALGILTVLRYSIQGLGYARLSVLSGVMEMLARGGVSLFLVPALHFLGVCYGDPVAWLAADAFLIPAIFFILHRERGNRLNPSK
jgi:putative MATE family efflux protein